jgi:hypothetical protein
MMWVSLFGAVFKALNGLLNYLQNKQLITALQRDIINTNFIHAAELADEASKNREKAMADFDVVAGVLDRNDPNLRDGHEGAERTGL